MKLFRELNEKEEQEFRKWARDNYRIYDPIPGIWHPVIQQECTLMNAEDQQNQTESQFNYDRDSFNQF